MSNQFVPGSGKKARNKQGSHSQPLPAWKGINEAERRDLARRGILLPDPEPAPPRRRRRRKTIKLWKDEAAVERGRKGAAARKANAGKRAAQSEHERRSAAARKGWAKIPKEERTRRAERGWETRDQRYGRTRASGDQQRLADEARRQRKHEEYGRARRPSGTYRAPF